MSKTINAKIVADSLDPRGNRITSYILTYPRFIHSELMTHRMFSRNAASSRAIPFKKMVEEIQSDPFIPIAWQKDHKGMQGSEYIETEVEIDSLKDAWLQARDFALSEAYFLSRSNVTKQLCNRLLEPFQWMTVLVTATEYDNFFELRCPKFRDEGGNIYKSIKDLCSVNKYDFTPFSNKWEASESGAEIHIQALAEAMWDARNESTPKELQPGEWHIPDFSKLKH